MWNDKHSAKTKQRGNWVGKTIFQKSAPVPSEGELVHPATGNPIPPESVESLAQSFMSLRAELEAAQALDPKLVQIIGILKKKIG